MSMQSDDIEDLFRDKLTNYKASPSDAFDSRILDSIIDHTTSQSKWAQFSTNWFNIAAGIIVGAGITTGAFLGYNSLTNKTSTSVITEKLISENKFDAQLDNATRVASEANTYNFNNESERKKTSERTLLENSDLIVATQNDTKKRKRNTTTAHLFASANTIDRRNKALENDFSASDNTREFSSNESFASSSMLNNHIEAQINKSNRTNDNRTLLSADAELDKICYSNIGFTDAMTMQIASLDEPEILTEIKNTAKDTYRRQSVELSAGIETYSQRTEDGDLQEFDIYNAALQYCAQFNNIELKTGVAVSKFGRQKAYDYTYYKTDSIETWFRVDSVDAQGQQIGQQQYDTLSNPYNGNTTANAYKYRLSVPVLVGYKMERNRFTAGIFVGAACFFDIAEKTQTPEFAHSRVSEYSANEAPQSTSFNTALLGQMQFGFHLTKNIDLVANGEYKRYLKPILNSNIGTNHNTSIGINGGLKFYF